MTLSDLAKYLMTQSIEQLLCDSWASCYLSVRYPIIVKWSFFKNWRAWRTLGAVSQRVSLRSSVEVNTAVKTCEWYTRTQRNAAHAVLRQL